MRSPESLLMVPTALLLSRYVFTFWMCISPLGLGEHRGRHQRLFIIQERILSELHAVMAHLIMSVRLK